MPTRKPELAYSKFCESLDCPLRNTVWSWSSINHDNRRALFSVWSDRLAGGRTVMWDKADFEYKRRRGGKEKIENLEAAMAGRYETYGIVCYAKDVNASPRERLTYDDQALLVLRLVGEPEGIVGHVIGETTPEAIQAGRGPESMRHVQYAVDDLVSVPDGSETADRAKCVRSDFRRDPAVREYVLRLADGRCEHCGKEGFLMSGGQRYLEAHHIIALADLGRDRIENVIALCAEHHREAHFGVNGEELEKAFLQRIAERKRTL